MYETHLNPGSDLSGFISHVGLGMPRHLGEALSVSQSTRALAMEEAHTFGVLPASSTRELCKPIRALRFSVRCWNCSPLHRRRLETHWYARWRDYSSPITIALSSSTKQGGYLISFWNFDRSFLEILKESERQGLLLFLEITDAENTDETVILFTIRGLNSIDTLGLASNFLTQYLMYGL